VFGYAAFLLLAALIDLNQDVQRRRESRALLTETFRDPDPIDRVHPIESLRDLPRLVRLKLADEVPGDVGAGESVDLLQRLLNVDFTEVP
jgi:hypothetical protein